MLHRLMLNDILFRPTTFPALLHHVIRVVLMSANKEMLRVDARWIVALMAGQQAFWDGAVCNLIAKARRSDHWPFSVIVCRRGYVPISLIVLGAKPQPARGPKNGMNRAALIDLPPKAFGQVLRWLRSRPMVFDKTNMLSLNRAVRPIALGDRSDLSASTHADATRVWGGSFRFAAMVVVNKANGLTLDDPITLRRIGSNLGFFAATALTKTVGNIERGIMGLHQKLTFLVSRPWCCSSSPRLLLFGSARSLYHNLSHIDSHL